MNSFRRSDTRSVVITQQRAQILQMFSADNVRGVEFRSQPLLFDIGSEFTVGPHPGISPHRRQLQIPDIAFHMGCLGFPATQPRWRRGRGSRNGPGFRGPVEELGGHGARRVRSAQARRAALLHHVN